MKCGESDAADADTQRVGDTLHRLVRLHTIGEASAPADAGTQHGGDTLHQLVPHTAGVNNVPSARPVT